jgi:hypothetical protein
LAGKGKAKEDEADHVINGKTPADAEVDEEGDDKLSDEGEEEQEGLAAVKL